MKYLFPDCVNRSVTLGCSQPRHHQGHDGDPDLAHLSLDVGSFDESYIWQNGEYSARICNEV